MSRPIIVGEGPSPRFLRTPNIHPLFGPPTRVICDLAGFNATSARPLKANVQRYVWLRGRARLENLCARKWDLREAESKATRLLYEAPFTTFILLGRKVARAFGRRDQPFFERHHRSLMGHAIIVIPHPSGLNRLYNEPDIRARAVGILADFLSLRSTKK